MFKYRSCGKINSFLNVLSEMPNGYHKINTHYQLIDIFDDIEFTENYVDKIESNAKLDFESNSIKRAINWFNKKFNKDQGFRIKLTKNIPIGAGLGGGSSNCATTLKFLCNYHGEDISALDLEEICFSLGADVPVFLKGFSSYAEGCGEILKEKYSTNSSYLMLIPNIFISTKKIFDSKFLSFDTKMDKSINSLLNVLLREDEVFNEQYFGLESLLGAHIFKKIKLSGSGSAMFIQDPDKKEIDLICNKIENNFRVFQVKALEYYH